MRIYAMKELSNNFKEQLFNYIKMLTDQKKKRTKLEKFGKTDSRNEAYIQPRSVCTQFFQC